MRTRSIPETETTATETTPSPDPPAPDAAAAVEAARSGSSTERVRRHRERKRQEAVTDFTDEDAAQTGTAIQVAWSLAVVPFTGGRIRDLREPEVEQLGRAFAPLVKKYLPMLADWQYEITAGVVLLHVIKECYVPPVVEGPPRQREGAAGPTPLVDPQDGSGPGV